MEPGQVCLLCAGCSMWTVPVVTDAAAQWIGVVPGGTPVLLLEVPDPRLKRARVRVATPMGIGWMALLSLVTP